MRYKNSVALALSAGAAAVFAFVPLFGFLSYGAVIQLLDMFGEAVGWKWLDDYEYYSGFVAWTIFTLIFFIAFKLWLRHSPNQSKVHNN